MQRRTPQRLAILGVIEAAGRPVNAEEVFAAASEALPQLGIATVYRTLRTLADSGIVETVELAGEPLRYETAGKGHHDHFQCNACRRVYEVEDCPVRTVRLPPGFVAESHEVVVRGICADCRRRPRRR